MADGGHLSEHGAGRYLNAAQPWLTKVDATPLIPELRDWFARGGRINEFPGGAPKRVRAILRGDELLVTVETLDKIATAMERPWLVGELAPLATSRPPRMVECPCCRANFEYKPPERPFRVATAESVAGPPDVRPVPKNVDESRRLACAHCGNEYHPAKGTKRSTYCSKSCSRRAALARKHGFTKTQAAA